MEENRKSKSGKRSKKNGISLFQSVLCVILSLAFGILCTGEKGRPLKENIAGKLKESVSFEELTKVFSRLPGDFTQQEETAVQTVKLSYKGKGKSVKKTGGASVKEKKKAPEYIFTVKPRIPAAGEISSPFGERTNPVTGEYSMHSGIDIAADLGSPVKAAYYGVVDRTGESEISGNYIVMTHSGGIETRYYHCGEILVSPGNVIRAGEVIAAVGDTGRSTGPHLHFEIRLNGEPVNPAPVIEKYGI